MALLVRSIVSGVVCLPAVYYLGATDMGRHDCFERKAPKIAFWRDFQLKMLETPKWVLRVDYRDIDRWDTWYGIATSNHGVSATVEEKKRRAMGLINPHEVPQSEIPTEPHLEKTLEYVEEAKKNSY